LHVEVRNDVVASATSYRSNQQIIAAGLTVPQMFASIRQGMVNGSAVSVVYDRQTGAPRRINIPNPPNWADADWAANVGTLRLR
jgi:TPP-dependent pyruvate/acetoin dehydrogenase alpha subunit